MRKGGWSVLAVGVILGGVVLGAAPTPPAAQPGRGRGLGRGGGGGATQPWDGTFRAGRGGGGGGRFGAASMPAMMIEPRVHDPVMMKEGETYYVYYTGGGIMSLRSRDLVHWERNAAAGGSNMVHAKMPEWAMKQVPGARDMWAPDIAKFGGKYWLYYSVSTFGSDASAIGVATNSTLDPGAPGYGWVDQGMVVTSARGGGYNAIDPNVVLDEKGEPWLNFGSFWNGIQLVKLDAKTGKPAAGAALKNIASRPGGRGGRAIEAPFIVRREGKFYQFVSFDVCCRGADSTYRVMVGRADHVEGPYVDKAGKALLEGGGTEVLAGDGGRVLGPGHCAVVRDDAGGKERWLMVHHFYDGQANGASKLQIRGIEWGPDGWPVVGKAINGGP